MKCPKCEYLGFETGDRCKNCGYDFSLATIAGPREPELLLREPEPARRDSDRWLNQLEARLDSARSVATSSAATDPLGSMRLEPPVSEPRVSQPGPSGPVSAPVPAAAAPQVHRVLARSTSALPLFHPGSGDSDEPLIQVPAAPRPLAVRRTPDKPHLRTVPKPVRKTGAGSEPDPVFAFAEEPTSVAPVGEGRLSIMATPRTAAALKVDVSGPTRRLIAAALDHLILLSIDVAVIYFTFQIAGVPFSSWQAIPILPLALFLLLVKSSYFCVFTALGGQTVGKMATGIRVVAEDDRDVEPARAVQRTLAAIASVATVGIGFAPALFAGDRRTLHDRVAGTRVVGPVHE